MLSSKERFKELLRKFLHHGILHCIKLETFYNGLNAHIGLVVDASANGALLSKTYNEAYKIIKRITSNNYQWSTNQVALGRRIVGVHEVDVLTSLSAQLSHQSTTEEVDQTTLTCNIEKFNLLVSINKLKNHHTLNLLIICKDTPLENLENQVGQFASELKSKPQGVVPNNIENSPTMGQLANELRNRPQGALPGDMENLRKSSKENCKAITL
ncbi:Retrotransposon gag protein [Gossypium australe]|uniref:Retrotransposon gag protein n=1 Tax=Gossypium australe TaxID=47621 RepID=A0A5B6WZS4_9ROSI|nr:Retrotransposon gag protein [Gossypium australe]